MPHDESQEHGTVDHRLTRHGGLSYLQIPAIDARRSARFYARVLGWLVEDGDDPKFTDRSGHLIGRWITGLSVARDAGVLPYFYVDQIDAALAQVTANDGEVVKPKYAEGKLWISTVRDPAENLIGLWQDNER